MKTLKALIAERGITVTGWLTLNEARAIIDGE
jgi:hypothetical protein